MRNEPHDPLRRRTLQGAGLALLAPLLPGCGGGSADSMPPESCSAAQVACVGREAIHKAMAQSGTVALSVALWSGGEVVWQEAFGSPARKRLLRGNHAICNAEVALLPEAR